MFAPLRRFALLLLLVLLPLQSTAAAIGPILCMSEDVHHGAASAPADAHHAHDQTAGGEHEHQHGGSDDSGNKGAGGHLCCCNFATAAPVSLAALPRADLPVFEPSLSLLATLFVPEQPQRPPRS